jgi:GTPase involved in cell partitioning and DNA repair
MLKCNFVPANGTKEGTDLMDVIIDELAKIEKDAAAIMDDVEIRKKKLDVAQKERIAKFDEEIKAKTEHEISGIKKELEDSREKQVRQLSDESHEKFRTIDSYYENSRERIADEIFDRIIRK